MKFTTLFDPKTEWDFVGKIPLAVKIAILIPIISIVAIFAIGFPFGLDFTGGTEMQIRFDKAVSSAEVKAALNEAGFKKAQIQQIGAEADHEMLIRIEQVSSLNAENKTQIADLLKANIKSLQSNSDKGAADLKVEIEASEGDRVKVWLPEPKVSAPIRKKDDAGIVVQLEKIRSSINLNDAVEAQAFEKLTDSILDKMSAVGYDRAAVTAYAKAKNWEILAAPEKQVEPEFQAAYAMNNALDAQQKELTTLMDTKTGLSLRRTRNNSGERTTEDALLREEPYQGMVKYIVNFTGVSSKLEKSLNEKFGKAELLSVNFVDAQVAKSLQTDGLLAVIYALLLILVYIAIRFDIFFSPGAILALLHDSLGALAIFPLLQIDFDLPSIAALLTVVGYSINNTIVIYDRIRETMPDESLERLPMEKVKHFVNKAINDTFSRTINTTLTTLAASVALFIFTSGVVNHFALVLSVGILLGAFSSTFIAPAAYLWFRKNFMSGEVVIKEDDGLSHEDKLRGVV